MRRALIVLPALILLAFFGWGLLRTGSDAALGGPAPEFKLPTVGDPGESLTLSELRGAPVVLNFWASWCTPCKQEAPLLAEVSREADDVRFLGVNFLDGREEALRYVEKYGIGFPSVRDATGRLADRFGVTGAPETFFIDTSGRIAGRYIGAFRPGELERLVDELRAISGDEVLDITGRGETRPLP